MIQSQRVTANQKVPVNSLILKSRIVNLILKTIIRRKDITRSGRNYRIRMELKINYLRVMNVSQNLAFLNINRIQIQRMMIPLN